MHYELANSTDEVRQWLADALELVDELGVPDDLRENAFTLAVQYLSTKTPVMSEAIVPGALLPRH